MEIFAQNLQSLEPMFWWMIFILLWTVPWKGYALWRSAKNNHKKWFIILFIFNTLALLEIFYIFWIDRKQK